MSAAGVRVRLTIVLIAAALLAVQIVRNGFAELFGETNPAAASAITGDFPQVELSLAMTEMAEASKTGGQAAPQHAAAMVTDAASKEPLAPEPFLVRGIQAQLARDGAVAERAFQEAQWRDPRSRPAAYFLAQRYVLTGKTNGALHQLANYARLSPRDVRTIAPSLAVYARHPAEWPAMRQILRSNSELEQAVLSALAPDPSAAPAVLALAGQRRAQSNAPWLAPFIATLIRDGQYDKARETWLRLTGAAPSGLLYDTVFQDKTSPPPFNWDLTPSKIGLAERQGGARLHVIFYGQDNGVLARQMLLLPQGEYRLSLRAMGDQERARSLNWSIWCDKADSPIASVRLEMAAANGWTFRIPSACPAQWLMLSGASSADVSQQVDVTISQLKLERVRGG